LRREPLGRGRVRTIVDDVLALAPPTSFQKGGARRSNGLDLVQASSISTPTTARRPFWSRTSCGSQTIRQAQRRRLRTATFGNRLVNYAELRPRSTEDAVYTTEAGSSGYPLNAFISSVTLAELGLNEDQLRLLGSNARLRSPSRRHAREA
jgi:hypothetical protein